MESNLIDLAKSYFNDEVLTRLENSTGENKEQVNRAVDVAIPSLLLGLQNQSGGGLASILDQARHHFANFDFNNITGSIFGSRTENAITDNTGTAELPEQTGLLHGIFGNSFDSILHSLTNFLGIKSSSLSTILGAALPAVLSSLTNKGTDWDLSSITNVLNSNKSSIASALPAGLGLGAFGSIFATAETPKEIPPHPESNLTESYVPPILADVKKPVEPITRPPIVHTTETVQETKKGAGLWWLLIPLLLLLLWFLFGKGCQGDKDAVVSDTTDTTVNTAIDPMDTVNQMVNSTRQPVDLKLPNGESLKAYATGIEENLINFLQSDYKALTDDQLKDKWFDFDNLNFETGTATVVPDSKQQLQNIAAILKVFPDAKVKIGGYTDKTGDEAINKKLSQDRANTVKAFLTEQGLGNQVVDAEGYGSQFATVDATASDTDRAKDRRVAVSVRK